MAEIDYAHRNLEQLRDFVKYCNAHTELRFWQALLSWTGVNFILVAKEFNNDRNNAPYVVGAQDTYHWEGKNG